MSNFFRNRNSLGSIPTLKKPVSGGSPVESYATVTDGTTVLYYRKCGKMYVIAGMFRPNSYFNIIRGADNYGTIDTLTLDKLASMLGITRAGQVVPSEAYGGDYSSSSTTHQYWDGANWTSRNTTDYPVMAIIST